MRIHFKEAMIGVSLNVRMSIPAVYTLGVDLLDATPSWTSLVFPFFQKKIIDKANDFILYNKLTINSNKLN